MPAARTIDLPSPRSVPTGSAERSGTAARAALVTALLALAIALLAWGYYGTGPGTGFPDPTQQWTD